MYLSEQDTFFLLCTIVEDILPDYYSKSMIGSLVDVQVFDLLVRRYQPKMYTKISKSASIACIAVPWFMCLFIGNLPWNSTLCAIDLILTEGSRGLFVIGLSLLHACKVNILPISDESLLLYLRKGLKDCIDIKAFQRYIHKYYSTVTNQEINDLRQTQRPKVLLDIEIEFEDCNIKSPVDTSDHEVLVIIDEKLEDKHIENEDNQIEEYDDLLKPLVYGPEIFNQQYSELLSEIKSNTNRKKTNRGIRKQTKETIELPHVRNLFREESDSDSRSFSDSKQHKSPRGIDGMKEFIAPAD